MAAYCLIELIDDVNPLIFEASESARHGDRCVASQVNLLLSRREERRRGGKEERRRGKEEKRKRGKEEKVAKSGK